MRTRPGRGHTDDWAALVYADDPRLRRSGLLGQWLERRDLLRAQARVLADAAAQAGRTVPDRDGRAIAKLPGDPWALRGVPIQGAGIPGGAIAGTQPERELLRRG